MAEAQGVEDLTQQFEELDVSGIEKNKRIDTMWDTVLDHRYGYANGLAQTTYLVCKIDGETIIKENTPGTHAEINFINYLRTKKNSVAGDLTVYINNSPCNDCANALEDYLLTENKDINFTLYVTHLYNIIRKSCHDGKENHISHIHSHEDTYNGLKNLLSLGEDRCKIQHFTKKVWEELHEVMELTEDSQHKHRMRTYSTTNTKKKHDRSRKSEDDNIKSDLIHLQRSMARNSEELLIDESN